ncbi:MAG: methyltransferase domain-containing protein [Epsilonproteobacteria bacterium]|nr:methyltransferase domain-containing protein [Campylobacterota bacterium]
MTVAYEKRLSPVKVNYIERYLRGQRVLDVGAGHCLYSRWIGERNKAIQVTAIDLYEPDEIKDFSYLNLDLEQPLISLSDNSFDTILAFDIIEHISNEQLLTDELYRVCAPDGVLIGSVPHDDDGFLPAYNLTFKHRSDITHKRYYLPATIEQALAKSGFEVLFIQKCGGISPQVIAEFFPDFCRYPIRKMCGLLRKLGVIKTGLSSDLFFVAKKECV